MMQIPDMSREASGPDDEFRVFKKSTYNSDGWEPFLPRNPLDGTPFESVAIAFETRRRQLDVEREREVGKLKEEKKAFILSLPRRAARRLGREGIAADRTGLGSVVEGIEIIDENNMLMTVPPDTEPTEAQLKRYLKLTERRVMAPEQRLDQQVKRALRLTADQQEDHGREELGEEEEEEGYRAAMRALKKVYMQPSVIYLSLSMVGPGAIHFISSKRSTQEKALQLLKTQLAGLLDLTPAEIGFSEVTNTTVGTLNESAALDVQLAIAAPALAKRVVGQIRTVISDGSVAAALTGRGLPIAKAELRKGPALFPYDTRLDPVQRGFGAPAARLNRQVEAWTRHLQRQQELEAGLRRAGRGTSAGQTSPLRAGGAQGASAAAEDADRETKETGGAGGALQGRRRRKFALGKGDTLDPLEDVHDRSEGPSPARPPGGHGFALAVRPASQLASTVREYSYRQAAVAGSTEWIGVLERSRERRARSAAERLTSEQWQAREDPRPPADGGDAWSLETAGGSGVNGSKCKTEDQVSRLADYFSSARARKAAPQDGRARADTLVLAERMRAEAHEASVARGATLSGADGRAQREARAAAARAALQQVPWRLNNAGYNHAEDVDAAEASASAAYNHPGHSHAEDASPTRMARRAEAAAPWLEPALPRAAGGDGARRWEETGSSGAGRRAESPAGSPSGVSRLPSSPRRAPRQHWLAPDSPPLEPFEGQDAGVVPAPLPPHHPLLLEGDGPRSRSPPAVRDSFLSKQGARQHTGALAPVQGGASVPVHAADSPSDQGSSPDADGGLRTRSSPLGGGWRAERDFAGSARHGSGHSPWGSPTQSGWGGPQDLNPVHGHGTALRPAPRQGAASRPGTSSRPGTRGSASSRKCARPPRPAAARPAAARALRPRSNAQPRLISLPPPPPSY